MNRPSTFTELTVNCEDPENGWENQNKKSKNNYVGPCSFKNNDISWINLTKCICSDMMRRKWSPRSAQGQWLFRVERCTIETYFINALIWYFNIHNIQGREVNIFLVDHQFFRNQISPTVRAQRKHQLTAIVFPEPWCAQAALVSNF